MSRNRIGGRSRSSIALVLLVSGALAAVPLGCGRTTTLGDARIGDDSSPGGSAGSNAQGSAGQGADSGNAGAGNSGGSGAAGEVGAGGAGVGGTGTGGTPEDAGPLPCRVPRPPADPNATPEQRERATLVHEACQVLAEHDCFNLQHRGPISREAVGCSPADRALACEQDALLHFARQIEPTCEKEWRTLVLCELEANRTSGSCQSAGALWSLLTEPIPCPAERDALNSCSFGKGGTFIEVTGSRGTCHTLSSSDSVKCGVTCEVGKNWFASVCEVLPGIAVECTCGVNGRVLEDDLEGSARPFYASDCRDAAQRMADGECIERLDCCFTYPGANDTQFCACTPDPLVVGWSSCEVAAQQTGGKVVEICPQYVSSSCRPPGGECP